MGHRKRSKNIMVLKNITKDRKLGQTPKGH